jgi:hypothetical protein
LAPLTDERLDLEAELDGDPEVMRFLTGRASSGGELEQAPRRRPASARELPGLGMLVGFDQDAFIGWWVLEPDHPTGLCPHAYERSCRTQSDSPLLPFCHGRD